jgi:hypothetical protein
VIRINNEYNFLPLSKIEIAKNWIEVIVITIGRYIYNPLFSVPNSYPFVGVAIAEQLKQKKKK